MDHSLRANGFIAKVTDADGIERELVANPVQFDETPVVSKRAPPRKLGGAAGTALLSIAPKLDARTLHGPAPAHQAPSTMIDELVLDGAAVELPAGDQHSERERGLVQAVEREVHFRQAAIVGLQQCEVGKIQIICALTERSLDLGRFALTGIGERGQ